MKFSIITPTYKRKDKLTQAVLSTLHQTHTDWEMIIINDSPSDASYASFEKTISDPRIVYLKNAQNAGVNFSRNRALDDVSKNSDWVILLDDDDYLAPDALATFHNLITSHPDKKWFVTNRAFPDGNPVTKFPKSDVEYSYALDYLIFKRCKGDATHCIKKTLVNDIRFSKLIKQAEEWIFFYQIGLKSKIFYHFHNSTITNGYDNNSGLNLRNRTRSEQLKTLAKLIYEGAMLRLIYHPTFLIYLLMRLVRLYIKH